MLAWNNGYCTWIPGRACPETWLLAALLDADSDGKLEDVLEERWGLWDLTTPS